MKQQIKCTPSPELKQYDLGDNISLEDGLYITSEGSFVVEGGTVLCEVSKYRMRNKSGELLDPAKVIKATGTTRDAVENETEFQLQVGLRVRIKSSGGNLAGAPGRSRGRYGTITKRPDEASIDTGQWGVTLDSQALGPLPWWYLPNCFEVIGMQLEDQAFVEGAIVQVKDISQEGANVGGTRGRVGYIKYIGENGADSYGVKFYDADIVERGMDDCWWYSKDKLIRIQPTIRPVIETQEPDREQSAQNMREAGPGKGISPVIGDEIVVKDGLSRQDLMSAPTRVCGQTGTIKEIRVLDRDHVMDLEFLYGPSFCIPFTAVLYPFDGDTHSYNPLTSNWEIVVNPNAPEQVQVGFLVGDHVQLKPEFWLAQWPGRVRDDIGIIRDLSVGSHAEEVVAEVFYQHSHPGTGGSFHWQGDIRKLEHKTEEEYNAQQSS